MNQTIDYYKSALNQAQSGTWTGISTTTVAYSTTIPINWSSNTATNTGYNYTWVGADPFYNSISEMFTMEEKTQWLIENGYASNETEEFYRHVKERFKAFLLAPKMKLSVKLPKAEV